MNNELAALARVGVEEISPEERARFEDEAEQARIEQERELLGETLDEEIPEDFFDYFDSI